MKIQIRTMDPSEYPLLENFLYEAIFLREGEIAPPKEIIQSPQLQVYIAEFGSQPDDIAFVAEVENKVIAAVFSRIMNDYGHVDNETPSLAISLYKEYRRFGIGKALMKTILHHLQIQGYKKISLSVQKDNYAYRLYESLGFEILEETQDEYIMIKKLLI